ncbi:FxsB family radical SAM/SPASM domain protein [Nocardia sp. NBC_01503]|uniref:FxsB family cyclophane-forming radical SAM/SPASM peptide maturase n=1 Tax=Nocardia sp. NBC_01503 TaxID=2975997 RepID=UPI002E7AB50A|nr:FxsB family cyclophane-forming radical SAM/SPASM peptide maturase [Nocardia sp. NBC_01503]WTL29946.1 FxsB family radical SAM/SPASM domain protein [Nocardia sp. NBC_01503]
MIKVHSRCDLACDYCYMYEHADQSWRGRPMGLAPATATRIAFRIAEHAAAHELPEVAIVLHGGEPLLLGVDRTREFLATLHTAIAPVARLNLHIHTNGVLLSPAFLDLFTEYNVRVGVSLDGDRAANDRHRLYRNGRSSYDRVSASLELLRKPRYRALFSGLLCTVDIANDPVAVYRGLLAQDPPRMDLIMPHSNWEHQPPGLRSPRDPDNPKQGGGEYGRWLIAVFDAWNADGRPVPLRTFESVVAAMYGRPSSAEAIGLDQVDLLVIETDGSLEQVDSLKTAYEGAAATGLDVWDNSLDEAAVLPGITVRRDGIDGVSAICKSCPVVQVCGGGFYPDRYRPGAGFDNPSVYCSDLKEMIDHVAESEAAAGRGGAQTAAHGATAAAHSLSDSQFDQLAAGFGDAETINWLAQAQSSLQRELLAGVGRFGPQKDENFTAAWDVLVSLDASAPEAVARVLAHPYTRVWATALLEGVSKGELVAADVRHLQAVAASAALHAGRELRLPIPVRDGIAPLPTFGAVKAGAEEQVWIETGSIDDLDLLHPVRLLTATDLTVPLEDTDPYRIGHSFAADRLGDAEAQRWQVAFAEGIDFIDAHLPGYAPGLRAGLRAVMPMEPEDSYDRSASLRAAFGAVGIALRPALVSAALPLIHEFQHVKMGAILDMFALFDRADTEPRYYAPWRPDPRPIEGLLQGTYAHIGVTDFWRVHRTLAEGAQRQASEREFVRWRLMTAEAIRQLQGSGSLTPLGDRFAAGMSATVRPWLAEPVDAEAESAALDAARAHRAAFDERVKVGNDIHA